MNPISTALVAGALIVAGKWSKGDSPNVNNAVGIGGIAIILALLEQMNKKMASAFGILIVLTIAGIYLPPIVQAAGFAGSLKGPTPGPAPVSHPTPTRYSGPGTNKVI